MGSINESEHAYRRSLQNSGSLDRDSAPELEKYSEACSKSSPEVWALSRADADRLESVGDLEAARAYVAMWPNHPPDYFQDSPRLRKRRARARAWGDGDAWAFRMVLVMDQIGHFSLHWHHVGLERKDAEARGIKDPAVIARWKKALRRLFKGPLHWHLEVGERGVLHCHVIADFDDGPQDLRRPSAVVRDCTGYLETAVAYQYKPSLPYSAEMLALYWEARRERRRLPNTSGTLGFANPSVTPYKLPSPPPSAPDPIPVLDPPARSARAFEGTAQARLGSAPSAFARGSALHALSVRELLQVLDAAQIPPKTRESRLGGVSRPERALKTLGMVSGETPLDSVFADPVKPGNVLKSSPRRENRLKHGAKHLRIATAGRLIPVAKPPRRSPWARLVRAIRGVFSLPDPLKRKIRSSRAPPHPVTRRAEERFKPLLEKKLVDVRTAHAETVSVALRYHSEGSKPFIPGGFTYGFNRDPDPRRQAPRGASTFTGGRSFRV